MNLREDFINFYKQKGHAHIPSASLVPENDPTCLFTTAGMHPLVPFLLGAKHPSGTRLANVQRCVRTTDIEEVGDKTHHTFFEMLGNWSLGDYFKKEAIEWSFEFLTKVLKIPVERLGVTVFGGSRDSESDKYSASIWQGLGIPKERVVFLEDNWWGPAGETGPCGPCTEMFYWSDNNIPAPKLFNPEDNRWIEIWNDVFMEFSKTVDGQFIKLKQKNVDAGMGLERTTAVLSNIDDNYRTEIFWPIIEEIEKLSGKRYDNDDNKRAMRILADHIRAIVMIGSDDRTIRPSNIDQGYVLRRLIRRFTRFAKVLEIDINSDFEKKLVNVAVSQLVKHYPELEKNQDNVIKMLGEEKNKFKKTLQNGLREFEKVTNRTKESATKLIPGHIAFKLYETFGFPIEFTIELANEYGLKVDTDEFKRCYNNHQALSRQGSEKKFKGGLADFSEKSARLHTATHLLLAGLRKYLGSDVFQKGSNITDERLRLDISYPNKISPQQINQVESFVNKVISENLPIVCEEMPIKEAKKSGAIGVFDDRYVEIVNVYSIGNYSKEICGGPHALRTGELNCFRIVKEEGSSAGIRRIKAAIDNK